MARYTWALFAVSAFLALTSTGRAAPAAVPIDQAARGPKPVVEVNLISFDPAIGDVSGRLHLRLPATMISKQASPVHDLTMVDAANVDESILAIPANKPFSYYDDSINSRYQVNDPGSQFMYPFDEHVTYLHFFVVEQNGGHQTPVPIAYDCSNCNLDGLRVSVADAGSTPTDVRLRVDIARTRPIIIFSVFLALAMWAMTLVIIVVAFRVARQKKKAPEVATMGFIGGLLFAFPAIRGAQPRVPPMGVLSDYFGFFWCELALIVTLIVVMVAWLRFPEEKET